MLKEFKAFAMKGNVMDMAIGIIIGGAFGKIVASFVSDVLMPPLGLLMGGVNFTDFKFILSEAVIGADGVETAAAVSINYGNFIQVTVDFIIVAFAIFMMIKAMNAAQKKEAAAPAAPPAPSKEEVLLGEIRDLLKK
jgi:large conductance mechanosensitive channel